MARIYRAVFNNVAISAVQDLLAIYPPTSQASAKQINFIRCSVTCVEPGVTSTPIMLNTRIKRMTGTVTPGSGGSTPSANPTDPGDSASVCTIHANDTSQATTNGTTVILDAEGFHPYNGEETAVQNAAPIPIPCNSSTQTAFIVELAQAPNVTGQHFSGVIEWAEAG